MDDDTQRRVMARRGTVGGVDFSGTSFVVQSPLVGTTYAVRTADGETVLEAKRKFFADGLTYEYSDGSGTVRFRYEDAGGSDARTRFRLVGSDSGTLATLAREEESWYRWRLDADGTAARIEGESGRVPLLDSQRGRHMTVTGPDGAHAGSVDRRILALRFTFDVDLPGLQGVTTAAVLLAVPLLYDAMREGDSLWSG